MSHFVFCVIYPIFPRNIIDVSHLHYSPLFMLQVQSDLSPLKGGQLGSFRFLLVYSLEDL